MRLIYWPTCPYACKVLGVLAALNLEKQVEKIPLHPWETDSPLPHHNPLYKIPVLITSKGDTLYDSKVICEYLDAVRPSPSLIPPMKSGKRWIVLKLQSLGDGLNDAAILKLTEENVRAPHLQSLRWIRRQQSIIENTLGELEKQAPLFHEEPVNLGFLSVCAALNYLSYRYTPESWKGTHPRLSTWHTRVMESATYRATLPIESVELPETMERLNT